MNDLVPPDGGWGYFVAASISLMLTATIVPVSSFGLVYGPLLAEWGNETAGTSLINGMFHTTTSFTGLIANQFLRRFSTRKVCLLGATLFFIGCLSSAFATNFLFLIVCYSGIQGLGFGLMIPAVFATFNEYFDKKKSVMNNSAQAAILAINMAWPLITKMLLTEYGIRGTIFVFAAFSLNAFPAALVLQPVKWHLKRRSSIVKLAVVGVQEELSVIPEECENNNKEVKPVEDSKWDKMIKALDLDLFKDPLYLNVSFGLAVSLASELAFTALLPLLLINVGFTIADTAEIMTIYFASDLVCRIMLAATTALVSIRNRTLFLIGAACTAVFRTIFIMDDSFIWKACSGAALGLMRCLIQTPIPLVIAENYSSRFASAFSLYMAVCGFMNLIFGLLIGFVKDITGSDVDVVHLLTSVYLICVLPWCIEMYGIKFCRRKGIDT